MNPPHIIRLLLLTTIAVGPVACQRPPAAVTIGMERTPVNALIYIARHRGDFERNQILLTINDNFPSGAAAVKALEAGTVDAATAAELVVVDRALAGVPLRVYASIDKFIHQYVIWRDEGRRADPAGLRGKRIGVPRHTQAEFNLCRFLEINGVSQTQVTMVDVPAPRAQEAFLSREVDAVVAWQPYVALLERHHGGPVVKRSIHNDQPTFCLLVSGAVKPERERVFQKLLTALAQAEDFLSSDRAAAAELVRTDLVYDRELFTEIWGGHDLFLTLDQSLIAAMETEARWMIRERLTDGTEMPNLAATLRPRYLAALRPSAVNLIGFGPAP